MEYFDKIHLFDKFIKLNVSKLNKNELINRNIDLCNELAKCNCYRIKNLNENNCNDYIRAFLNISPPNLFPNELINEIDQYIIDLYQDKIITNSDDIKTISTYKNIKNINENNINKICIWKGDITLLKIDVIVNACNEKLLGCFAPGHLCIDNAIHSFAGPRLRNDCNTIMELQGDDELPGKAKITRAYNLPSNYVIHTVGPIYQEHTHEEASELLKQCYIETLNLCNTIKDIKSIAFSSLSTGIYGFPIENASKIAIDTVNEWLINNPETNITKIVFNLFSDKDFNIYYNYITN